MWSGLSCKYSLIYCHSLQTSPHAWYTCATPTFKTSTNQNTSAIQSSKNLIKRKSTHQKYQLSLLLVFNYAPFLYGHTHIVNNRSCHSEMEYKLGTRSQVSIASSYICEVHRSSNCCGFFPDTIWLTMSHVNYVTHLVETPCLVTCK